MGKLKMNIKKTLEMDRSGEFDIKTYGNNHCGTDDAFKIRYHLKCLCSSKLDQRGFLFDQLNIQQFFESIQKTSLSCEQLTEVCLEQLLEHIMVENPGCQIFRMELALSPAPYMASMVHAWENPDNPLEAPTVGPKTRRARVIQNAASISGSETIENESKVHSPTHQHLPSHSHYKFSEHKDVGK